VCELIKRFKNGDFAISKKDRSEFPASMEEDECKKMGKSREKQWKILRFIYIVYFYLNKKYCKKLITFVPT